MSMPGDESLWPSIRQALGDEVEVRMYVRQDGKAVPQEVWIPATIVNEDAFGIEVVFADGGRDTFRAAERRLRSRPQQEGG